VVSPSTLRRPLPAVIALTALLLLTAIVWWRVLNRDTDDASTATECPQETSSSATLPAPGLVTVQVLNATSRAGIADKARSTLVDDGFKSPDAAANDKPKAHVRGVAEIRYGSKGEDGAKLLHYYFPTSKLVSTDSKSATVVVSLGRRYKGVASPSAVQAALREDQIELHSAPPGGPSAGASC
jgi:LytR cell envelope-related transcriptional attenuator